MSSVTTRSNEAWLIAATRQGRSLIYAAHIDRLRALLGPGLATSLGPGGVARLRAASVGLPSGRFPADCVQVPTGARGVTLVDRRFVAAAHARGLAVHVWTIDEPDEMDRLLDLGVDGIMTDRPAVLRQVLERRGAWV